MFLRKTLLLLAPVLAAQNATEPTLRITVNLIQVDAVVTDKRGQSVPNLTKEDFEILEDGKPRKVEYLSYISTPVVSAPAPARGPVTAAAPTAAPSLAAPREADIHRSIAIVVDDLALTFAGIQFVRDALTKFIDAQMQPGDLVAIIRTSRGTGALEQYTMDKRLLRAAVNQIRFHLDTRSFEVELPRQPGYGDDPARERGTTIASMLALRRVVDGLKQMPGRKSVLLFSDLLIPPEDVHVAARYLGNLNSLQSLADQANRAAVVFYTVQSRGLETFAMRSGDDVGSFIDANRPGLGLADVQRRHYGLAASRIRDQEGAAFLAKETGGELIAGGNDFAAGARKALQDQSGYYLLGYRPPEDAFATDQGVSRYHRLKVLVKRSGLKVRTRAGYFGIPDRPPAPVAKDSTSQLMLALGSPFAGGDIGLHLTGLFENAGATGSYVHAMLHIDGRGLQFADDEPGWKKAEVDLVLMAVGTKEPAAEPLVRHYKIRVSDRDFGQAVRSGFLYRLIYPIRTPGVYQIRAAVRDVASGKMGSGNQFIEVPDVSNGRMALSGILLESPVANATGGAALRVFPQGSPLSYGLVVYNPRLAGLRASQVQVQARLFRDGRPVWSGTPVALESASSPDATRVQFGRPLEAGPTLPPGEYLLQVSAIDKLAPKTSTIATQWTDFELTPAR